MLALLFFAVYLIFASIFNRPSYDADDIFFDADGNLYRWRFATEKFRDYYWRPAHPFILIIVRPLVGTLAFLFKGDMLFAAFTLNALMGALCVYLVWYFVKHSMGNPLYALLIAALFGATSTQLAFGSIIESYIYLSVIALVFLVLLLKDRPLYMQVIAGLVAFGITISNVGQTFIAHFFVRRNIKQIIIYGLIVGALVVPLSLLNNWVYPNSQPYFWELSTLNSEGHNQFPRTLQRANFMVRTMALHSFVAPEPLVIRDGFPFAKVWMFRASIKKDPMRISTYETPLGNGLSRVWAGLMMLGGVLFLKNIFKQDNGYSLTFIFTVLFFFIVYMQYGKDVFLYATNWTYAIMLFLALAWRELATQALVPDRTVDLYPFPAGQQLATAVEDDGNLLAFGAFSSLEMRSGKSLPQKQRMQAFRPVADGVPVAVIAFLPDAEQHAQAEHQAVFQGGDFGNVQHARKLSLADGSDQRPHGSDKVHHEGTIRLAVLHGKRHADQKGGEGFA